MCVCVFVCPSFRDSQSSIALCCAFKIGFIHRHSPSFAQHKSVGRSCLLVSWRNLVCISPAPAMSCGGERWIWDIQGKNVYKPKKLSEVCELIKSSTCVRVCIKGGNRYGKKPEIY